MFIRFQRGDFYTCCFVLLINLSSMINLLLIVGVCSNFRQLPDWYIIKQPRRGSQTEK